MEGLWAARLQLPWQRRRLVRQCRRRPSAPTGCLQSFTFDQGNPFVYLISRQGTLSGLRCVNDGVNGHLEGFTASPAPGDAFTTNHLVFGRQVNTRRLVPVSYDSGTLPAPADPAALALGSDITGCSLSQPAF